jgi:hypothetical protein
LPYRWRQTLNDVDVFYPLPSGTRAKELKVVLGQKTILVEWKNKPQQEALLKGELFGPIKQEESTWLIDNNELHIQLEVRFFDLIVNHLDENLSG